VPSSLSAKFAVRFALSHTRSLAFSDVWLLQKCLCARLAVLQAVLAHDIPHEILTAEQVNERFPGYRLPAHFKVGFVYYLVRALW